MEPSNPYASPAGIAQPTGKVDPSFPEAGWRDGNYVVTYQRGKLPDWCVVTGSPEVSERITETHHWPKSGEHKAEVILGLSPNAAAMLRYKIIAGRVLVALGLMLIFFSPMWGEMLGSLYQKKSAREIAVIAATCVSYAVCSGAMVVGMILLLRMRRQLTVVGIESGLAWYSGAHERFLAQLPPIDPDLSVVKDFGFLKAEPID